MLKKEFAIIFSCVHLFILSVGCLISLSIGHVLLFLGSSFNGSMSCRTRVNRYICPSCLPKFQPFGPNPSPNHSLKAFIPVQWLKSKTNRHRPQISQPSWNQSWMDVMDHSYSTGPSTGPLRPLPCSHLTISLILSFAKWLIFFMNMQWNPT